MCLACCLSGGSQYKPGKSKYKNDLKPLVEMTEEMRKHFGEVISSKCLKDKDGRIIPESCNCMVIPSGNYCDYEQEKALEKINKKLGIE